MLPRPSTSGPPSSTLVHDCLYTTTTVHTVVHDHLLRSTTIYSGPQPSAPVHDRPTWSTSIYCHTRGYNNIQCKDASPNSYVSRYRGNTEVSYTFKPTLHFTPTIKYTLYTSEIHRTWDTAGLTWEPKPVAFIPVGTHPQLSLSHFDWSRENRPCNATKIDDHTTLCDRKTSTQRLCDRNRQARNVCVTEIDKHATFVWQK